jgi:hypothetical protein
MEHILSLEEDELAPPTFTIDGEINRQYRRFNTVGTQLTIRLLPPSDATDPVTHFLASVNELFGYALRDSSDSDMVGITIRNEVNEQDKPVGFSFRRKDQVSREVIWNVLGRVAQSKAWVTLEPGCPQTVLLQEHGQSETPQVKTFVVIPAHTGDAIVYCGAVVPSCSSQMSAR